MTAPHLIDLEVVSAWRRMHTAGDIEERRVRLAIADLHSMPIERVAHTALVERCWELRANLTPYDASYVAVAEAEGVPLVTDDELILRLAGEIATAPAG